jgi:hypothetical protein
MPAISRSGNDPGDFGFRKASPCRVSKERKRI